MMDKLLLQRCLAGDPQAIEMLVRDHQGAIFRLCLSILDDAKDAEDATQEAFIAAIKALNTFRGDAVFNTWLYAIAVNVCRRQLKRRGRQREVHSALQTEQSIGTSMPPDPEQTMIQSEVSASLLSAVAELDEKHRIPIVLRYFHDLSVPEIARIMEINEGTAHSRLSNARERLHGLMKARESLFKKKETQR
jgi:RNA polymerase sigma-70 factor (ECF subfamily)